MVEFTNTKRLISTAHIKNVTITGDLNILLTPTYYERQRTLKTASIIPQTYIPPSLRKSPSQTSGQQTNANFKSDMDLFNSNIEDLDYDAYQSREPVIPRKEIRTSCALLLNS